MALTVHEPEPFFSPEQLKPDTLDAPPEVIITPSDPWPRPYYLEGNLRRVAPYHYTYNTNCKARWRNREILEIFADEFRDRPTSYYRAAIESGQLVINGQKATSIHQKVRNGDVISHTLHRHEPPVTAAPITIVHEDEDIIAINKPPGVPVHPTGRYNYNSVTEIMRAERGHGWNPLPCNRLDRLTSGIMFIGKHRAAADAMMVQIMGRTIKKEYVARVKGRFPDGEIICEQPILQISPKLGLNRVRANGKEARTVFRRLAYYPGPTAAGEATKAEADPNDEASTTTTTTTTPMALETREPSDLSAAPSNTHLPWSSASGYSIVRCLPLTGRTHQIRVHLQFLGHPIANDPIYCNQRVFGPSLARGDDSASHDEDIMTALARMGKEEVADAVAYADEAADTYEKRKAEKLTGEVCASCGTPLYSDPGAHELGIYLHAKRYAGAEGSWAYETPLPDWALPPVGVEGPRVATVETEPLAGVELGEEGVLDLSGLRRDKDVLGEAVAVEEEEEVTAMDGVEKAISGADPQAAVSAALDHTAPMLDSGSTMHPPAQADEVADLEEPEVKRPKLE